MKKNLENRKVVSYRKKRIYAEGTFSKKSFVGSRKYYYFDKFGEKRFFFYKGVPVKKDKWAIIVSGIFFVLLYILFISLLIYTFLPSKLESEKCNFYEDYVFDNGVFEANEKDYLTTALDKFYKETGIQPFVYSVYFHDLPIEYKPIDDNTLDKFAKKIYSETFDDEGHFLLLIVESEYLENPTKAWTGYIGKDAENIFDKEKFETFESDLNVRITDESTAKAVGDTVISSIDIIMRKSKSEKALLTVAILFFATLIILTIFGSLKSLRIAKQINEYCDYRSSQGGKDFIERDNLLKNDIETGGVEGKGLFD